MTSFGAIASKIDDATGSPFKIFLAQTKNLRKLFAQLNPSQIKADDLNKFVDRLNTMPQGQARKDLFDALDASDVKLDELEDYIKAVEADPSKLTKDKWDEFRRDKNDKISKFAGKTTPSKVSNINAKPKGSKTVISELDDVATKRSLIRENESAETLAKHGYDIVQNPIVNGTTKKPDYLVENKIFDCYSPSSNNARNIASNMELKVANEQTQRIILNLDDSLVSFDILKNQISLYPIKGLEEIIIIKGNQVIHFYPF